VDVKSKARCKTVVLFGLCFETMKNVDLYGEQDVAVQSYERQQRQQAQHDHFQYFSEQAFMQCAPALPRDVTLTVPMTFCTVIYCVFERNLRKSTP
jgi:hypothetical protein